MRRVGPFEFEGTQPVSFEDLIGRISEGAGRLTTASGQNALGFGGGDIGAMAAALRALSAPQADTGAVFAALKPFEDRAMSEAVTGVRSQFGSAGGRFSRNLSEAEAVTRGELTNQFARNRAEISRTSFEDAESRRIQALGAILPMLINQQSLAQGGGQDLLRTLLQFVQPGAAVQDPGLLPGLLGAGATLGGAAILNRGQ